MRTTHLGAVVHITNERARPVVYIAIPEQREALQPLFFYQQVFLVLRIQVN